MLDASNWSNIIALCLGSQFLETVYFPDNLQASQCHQSINTNFLNNCPNVTKVSCTASMKEFIQSKSGCPIAMQEGGTGTWLIVDAE